MTLTCCLQTFPISLRDPNTMEILGYTATETLLWDYSETEGYFVLAKPPAITVQTLFSVPVKYAYQWFGLNGANGLKLVYYPFSQINFKNLTDPCDCPSPTPPVSVGTTWDPVTAANVTLTDGNLTATNNLNGGGVQGVKVATASGKTSGKYYYEMTLATQNDTDSTIGIATTGADYTAFLLDGTGGVVCYSTGVIYTDGSSTGFGLQGIHSDGDVIAIAVDLDNRAVWFKCVGGPDFDPDVGWNGFGVGGADPATNSNGVNLLAGTMTPLVTFGGYVGDVLGNATIANFGATAFSGTVPTGFTSGWPE